MKLSVLTMIIFAACAGASNTPTEPETNASPWRIELTSSGGFAGRGAGNYTLDSSGAFVLTTMNGRTCTFQLEAEDVSRFTRLLAASDPESWKASYAPDDRCCDRIEYRLKVERDGSHTTEWIDDPLPMPQGLTNLWMAITGGTDESLRMKYDPQCR